MPPALRYLLAVTGCALLLGACFKEDLPEQTLSGEIVIPGDLIDHPADAGAIYVGVFSGYNPFQLGYPYPSTGPRVGDQSVGDAWPYGGTTLGAFSYACYRALRCEVVTGRYQSIDDLLSFHPIEKEDGELVGGEEFYDQCQWYFGWNNLGEFRFLADDPDFVKDSSGDWVAPFTALHTQLPAGASLWAFADNDNTSCSPAQGSVNRRSGDDGQFWREGTNYNDVLNYPDKYITGGDFLSEDPPVIEMDGDEVVADGYRVELNYVRE